MGRRPSLQVDLAGRFSFREALAVLTKSGWEVADVEGVSFLPLNAGDVGDWVVFSDADVADVVEVCATRVALGRVAGLVLTRDRPRWGGSFIWSEDGSLLVLMSIHEGSHPVVPDWNRFVAEVIDPLVHAGLPLQGYTLQLG